MYVHVTKDRDPVNCPQIEFEKSGVHGRNQCSLFWARRCHLWLNFGARESLTSLQPQPAVESSKFAG